jgi:DNA-binding transcriptional LysR family regulator
MMSSLSQFTAFSAVARHLSFAAASRELGLAPSSVAKAVSRLEQRMGAKLFQRTTRTVRLTAEGEALFERCADLLARVDALDQLTFGHSTVPAGTLRISAPVDYGGVIVVPVISRLLARHDELQVDLRLTDEPVDVIRDGLDAAIQLGTPPGPNHISREIDTQPRVLCASPEYLRRRGVPESVEDLQHHDVAVSRASASERDSPVELVVGGKVLTLRFASRLRVSYGPSLVGVILNDTGLAQIPLFMVRDHITEGRLIEVLPELRPRPVAVNVTTPALREASARTTALIEGLRKQVAEQGNQGAGLSAGMP